MQTKTKIAAAGTALAAAGLFVLGVSLRNGKDFRKEKPLGPEFAVFPGGKSMEEIREGTKADATGSVPKHPVSAKGV